ncbi:glutamate--tRNA ligase [Caulobacter sp. 17J80-11]|uniref:glutamate--tRNA ligase n=1 Tax=Caulobacter sp. 17J80-11 TaxID=2763502 RepID=UPI001653E534|nr:glutamate--tRNA ligase [Caulobacter sp. 17J80-11]MBC6981780.1 glutamate--tRNA ligase [Caulobacter sp. 17J80-11]
MSVKVRFAPSPTGRIHVGNVRAALANWLFAKRQGGTFVLRIDDTDLERSTKEYEHGIETDLQWLGLAWDERYNQSQRFPVYQEAVERLKAAGRLYPCYETQEELDRRRKVQLSRGQPPIYDRAALKLSHEERAALEAEGRRPHWRFKLNGERVKWNDMVRGDCEVDTASMSDPVLIREDGAFLYTLPSVVDDVDMKITHVIRGEDHVTNTGAQIEIFRALGAPEPAFGHMPLLVGADGGPLSKRLGALSISELRGEGFEPLAVTSHLAKIGTSDALEAGASLQALGESFGFEKMGRAPARYDPADLARLNSGVLHALSYADARTRLADLDCDLGETFWNTVRANLGKFEEVKLWARVVRGPIEPLAEDSDFLEKAAALLPEVVDETAWARWTEAVKAETGAKGKALFMPLRKALTGLDHGPDMAAMTALIGRERIEKRLRGQAA